MIYLLRSYGISGKSKSFLKIGFTNDIHTRSSQYFYMNPGCEIISVREGDYILESLFHYYLRYLGLQYKKNGKLNEWFIDDPRVYQVFHISQETIEKIIWKHRDKILMNLSSNPSNYKLFKYLYLKNKDSFNGEFIRIEGNNLIKTNAKKIDVEFWNMYQKSVSGPEIFEINDLIKNFLDKFNSIGIFKDKMKLYCEFIDTNPETKNLLFNILGNRFQKFYDFYGTKGCRSKSYEEKKLLEGMLNSSKDDLVSSKIYSEFKVGEKYTKKNIKILLGSIYSQLDIGISSKSTDLEKYFNLERTVITDPQTKKKSEGFKIISRK